MVAEPVEISRGKKIGSPNRNGAQEVGSRQSNINRLLVSPPLSKSQPYSSIQNGHDSNLSGSGMFSAANSFGSLNPVPETVAIDIPQQKKAEIVKKHLVTEVDLAGNSEQYGSADDLYSTSHKLPGGDATHEVYKWHAEVENAPTKRTRSRSLNLPRPTNPDTSNIREPGGFRRHHVIMKARKEGKEPPNMITRNFIDFLTMYGHFAGEDLSDDEDEDIDDYETTLETTPLLPRLPRERISDATATPSKAVFLLLKSFVGTGVMFLPKAFSNGGIVFSSIVLIFIAIISLCSFLLLVQTRSRLRGHYSFGDIGRILYGNWMRLAVLFSITISQIGFVCAYMIFVAKNLDSVAQVMGLEIELHKYIVGQLFVYVPLAMIRRISRLSFTALIADAFIMFGLLYLYYYDISKLSKDGISDIVAFNSSDFALFIGTAVFTFEGIGLIIPITESMKEPEKFPKVLTGVMIFITVLFTSIGILSYATFGSNIKTVVIINLPIEDPLVQTIQFLYALAIMLSIPLQLFPAIRIMEQGLFEEGKSGRDYPFIKWQKNIFRLCTVVACALISWGGASDLDKFVSLIGAFACVPLCFLYPPLFHYKVAHSFKAKMLDVFIICFGGFSLFYTTYITIRKWGA